ncbi:hypothetical protein L1049_006077 [Liquidambar formosana]|uniref:Uncharacterized protein n=1 Tax=Liquidambar formosana TaxID=63359 RepID=A0AAP0RGB7_LIQFO
MVRLTPIHTGDSFALVPLAIGLFVTVSVLVALCAKHASRVAKKYAAETSDSRVAPNRSPLPTPKKLLTTISNKAMPFMQKKKGSDEFEDESEGKAEEGLGGESGLWQRTILMGEKCQPPEFSGVIYYDNYGNQLPELPPRSPRASPLPNLSYLMAGDAT